MIPMYKYLLWGILFPDHTPYNWSKLVKQQAAAQNARQNLWMLIMRLCKHKNFRTDTVLHPNQQVIVILETSLSRQSVVLVLIIKKLHNICAWNTKNKHMSAKINTRVQIFSFSCLLWHVASKWSGPIFTILDPVQGLHHTNQMNTCIKN